ncbi:MAG: phosphotransferase [Candidatus Coatesbacteria bacterium]|nr:phosphotransferase [Candidatus Coatesbacteria bacterium]
MDKDCLRSIEENLKFMLIEVIKQIEDTLKAIDNQKDTKYHEKVFSRDDYIDNLKNVIENKSSTIILDLSMKDKKIAQEARIVANISNNLEHIADYAVNITRQLEHFNDHDFTINFNYKAMFKEIIDTLNSINKGLQGKNINTALKICRSEILLDKLYKDNFDDIMQRLKNGGNTENLITMLFIFQYLERIGDSLLNIGESLINKIIGEKIKIHQFHTLNETIEGKNQRKASSDYYLEPVAETKSGSIIRKVHKIDDEEDSSWVIFKEGKNNKIEKEKENIEKWHRIDDKLTPRILGFNKDRWNASILIEYLRGKTYRDMLINSSPEDLSKTFFQLAKTMSNLWHKTMKKEECNAGYLDQLNNRIEDVYKVHPWFRSKGNLIGDIEVLPFEEMIKKISLLGKEINAPFTVFIHGDFNIDNIIFNHSRRNINFIDLHRSKDMDYLQDISVFIISNYRLPIFEKDVRTKIKWTIRETYNFVKNFAYDNNDTTFEIRLGLGLIRSFITSTRFELNKDFAKDMYLKSIYLIEKILMYKEREINQFKVPIYIFED